MVNADGTVAATTTLHPLPPQRDAHNARRALSKLLHDHAVKVVALGNGTGCREAEAWLSDALGAFPAVRPVPLR